MELKGLGSVPYVLNSSLRQSRCIRRKCYSYHNTVLSSVVFLIVQGVASMPFTLYHWGPGLLFGLLFLTYIDLPTFLLASVIIDVEPFLVLALNLRYPVHGYLHTFLGGTVVALLLWLVMRRVREALSPFISSLRLEQEVSSSRIGLASLFGIYLHILLDSPLYSEIRPFYPFETNPVLGHSVFFGFDIYPLCAASFIGAAFVYAARVAFHRKM